MGMVSPNKCWVSSCTKRFFKQNPSERSRLTVSTKFFPTLPENLLKGLERSLKRLLLDYIDIYYIHWPNDKSNIPGILDALETARNRELIRAVGVSNFTVSQMEEAARYCRIDYCQTGYSLLWRQPEETLIPWCRRRGIKVFAYSPLAQGILTNGEETSRRFIPQDPRRQLLFFRDEKTLNTLLPKMETAAAEYRLSLPEAALGWLRLKKAFSGILTGFSRPEQVEIIPKILSRPLPFPLFQKLEDLSREYRRSLEKSNPEAENIWDHNRSAI